MKRLISSSLPLMMLAVVVGVGVGSTGCHRSGTKEAPITGKPSDPPVTMAAQWEPGRRYLFHVEVASSILVPRRNTGIPIHAETTLGQDLAFTVTNAPAGDGRIVQMEVQAIQMETSKDDGVTMTFDSSNKAIFVEESPLVDRLQKLVGLRLTFILSGENRVTRVEGLKDLNDRMSTGGNAVRGVAADVARRFFNQQFFRDVVEMGILPTTPVKVEQTWTETRSALGGFWGTGSPVQLTHRFRGWQRRDGTNCARIDFIGTFRPASGPPGQGTGTGTGTGTNSAGGPPPPPRRGGGMSTDEGTVLGRAYYNPDLGLAVESIFDQSLIRHSTSVRMNNTVRKGDTNSPGPGSVPAIDLASGDMMAHRTRASPAARGKRWPSGSSR